MMGSMGRKPAHGTQCSVRDLGKECLDPLRQRLESVIADVEVVAVELCGACDTEAVFAKTRGDHLGLVVQQGNPRCSLLGWLASSRFTVIEYPLTG